MKKYIFILLTIFLLFIPTITAGKIEVLIEHKVEKTQLKSFSIQNEKFEKFEIKNITKEEFEQLKKNDSILIQENIPKRILLDVSIQLIEADSVWELKENQTNITGKGQTICILDTGAQLNHPSLIGKNATCNIDCATDPNNCIENCSLTDPNGHGTHVAGIITSTSGTYKGVTLNTKYIPVMVCDINGDCSNQAVWSGLDWCIENKNTYNISIISMSLGGGQFSSYCDSSFPSDATRINNAVANNISVVAATGNLIDGEITNNSAGISNPACIENSIRVGNTDDFDNMANSGLRHNFFTDIITAPGVGIISTYPTNAFASSSGTSMSTPHVSGSIALLNQYKKLESNTILTPSQIKQFILDSGKTIYDSSSNQNYTRISTYQTILYSDEQPPQIEAEPNENLLKSIGNQTFSCNATDNLQLKNLTLQIYNSTDLIYNTTNSSPTNNLLIINETINLSEIDIYTWNCIAYDNQSNYNEIENKTISTYSIQTQITQPTNNTFTTQNETNFNCSVESSEELSNITFYIYNSTDLLYNKTKNITGVSNYSTFNYTLPNETTYYYNCLSINNLSYSDQTKNYTITYDITSPKITLTSPTNNSRTTTKTHTFTFSENETNKDYCNLTINNETQASFTKTLTDGIYYWNVTCTDKANNTNTSETFKLEIYTEPIVYNGGSGGGGGGATTPKTYTITEEQSKTGIQQKLKEKESINFKIKSQDHKITLNEINEDKVNLTLESTPKTIILYLNSPTKINIDNDETFDLELILLETNTYANIFIKEIHEIIPQKRILTPEIKNETNNQTTQPEQKESSNLIEKIVSFFKSILRFFGIKI